MYRKYILLIGFCLLGLVSFGQRFMPFAAGNESGLMAQPFQPASMAGTLNTAEYLFASSSLRMQGDVVSFTPYYWFTASAYQKGYKLRDSYFTPAGFAALMNDFDRPFDFGKGKDLNFTTCADVNILSVGYRLDYVSALSFGYGYRGMQQMEGVSDRFLEATYLMRPGLSSSTSDTIKGGPVNMNGASWEQFYVNYAKVFLHTPQHYLRWGVTGKVAFNAASGFFHADSYQLDPQAPDKTSRMQVQGVHAGGSQSSSYGIGADFGAEYQYQPDFMKKERVPYLLKVGLSVSDLGYLQFRNAQNRRSDLLLTSSAALSLRSSYEEIAQRYGKKEVSRAYVMNMPTMAHVMADLQLSPIVKNLYLFMGASYAFERSSKIDLTGTSSVVVSPRYDHEWIEIGVPMRYTKAYGSEIGISARLWNVLWVGSSNIFTQVGKKKSSAADVHLALRIPFPWVREKDRDWDGIPDASDKCPDNFGKKELKGCPDRDGDGIPDHEDACPDERGYRKYKGCPKAPGSVPKKAPESKPTPATDVNKAVQPKEPGQPKEPEKKTENKQNQ